MAALSLEAENGVEAPSDVSQRRENDAAHPKSAPFPLDVGRLSTSSSSTDESSFSPRDIDTTPAKAGGQGSGEEEEREKQASDSGYESDRRRSFSFPGDAKEDGAAVDCAPIAPKDRSEIEACAPSAVKRAKEPEMPRRKNIENQENRPPSKAKECHPLPLPLMPPHPWPMVRPLLSPMLHPLHHHQLAIQHQAMLAHAQFVRPFPPHPTMLQKQAEAAAMETPRGGPWEHHIRILSMQRQNPQARAADPPKPPQQLPPVVLPLPVCCKASSVGPKEARKYAIPKYAVGFVFGLNGTRIQATRDVSGATILPLGDSDDHSVIGVFGTQGQIHDAVFLMKQNIMRHSGMFIGDINGMLKPINE